MELAKQVTSLEISKKLIEVGFYKTMGAMEQKETGRQNSLFEHICNYVSGEYSYTRMRLSPGSFDTSDMKISIPAYTASEIMWYLPDYVETEPDYPTYFVLEKLPDEYIIQYTRSDIAEIEIRDESFVNCLGKTLIYLLSNNLIDGNGR